MRTEQQVLLKVADSQNNLTPLLEKIGNFGDVLSQPVTSDTDNEINAHLRNIDQTASRLVAELTAGRELIVKDIRSEIKLLAKTVAAKSGRVEPND